jgi:membrane protein
VIARVWVVLKRTGRSFYDDQMNHHAAALTYYTLMSLFPAMLLGISLLSLLGQYPETYNAVVSYLREVVPRETLTAIDHSLRTAIREKGNAIPVLLVGVVTALYGTTGVLEALRRALNVAFRVESGRSFLRRKGRDILSSFILIGLVLVTLVLVFVGGRLAEHAFGEGVAHVWNIARWPGAVVIAMLAFNYIYYVTPDLKQREFHVMTPGAVAAVIIWIVVSYAFSEYLSNYPAINAIYGAFASAIILVIWVWLTNVAVLFGAELNAVIARSRVDTKAAKLL